MDTPWRRLPWILPIALGIGMSGLWGMGLYLKGLEQPLSQAKFIEAQFVELPPPPSIQSPPVKHHPLRPKSPPPPEPAPPPPEAAPPVPEVAPQPTPPPPSVPVPSTVPLPAEGQGARVIYRPMPRVPDDLREEALTAVAVARFRVDADGTAAVELITPTRNPRLNQVILDTLRTWRFFPALKDGRPVASMQDIRISVEVR